MQISHGKPMVLVSWPVTYTVSVKEKRESG